MWNRLATFGVLVVRLSCIDQVSSDVVQPNILFIMTDQQRDDTLSAARTPHLAQLAAEGARFTKHYASSPSCTPARATILTGRGPWRAGMLGYGHIASSYEFELPTELASLGYKTVMVGKNHFGWDPDKGFEDVKHGFKEMHVYDGLGDGFNDGEEFDDYYRWFQEQRPGADPLQTGGLNWNDIRAAPYEYEEWLHPTSWNGRIAVQKVLELATLGKPWFFKVSFHRPHPPFDPPRRLLDATPELQKPPATAVDGWSDGYRCCDVTESSPKCGELDAPSLNLTRRAYHALVTFVDEKIGALLAALRDSGQMSNTFRVSEDGG